MEEFTVIDGQRRYAISSSQLEGFFTSYQLNHQPNCEASCPLCRMNLSKERIHRNSDDLLIIDTRNRKGHESRIMVLTRKHGVQHPKEILEEAVQQLIRVGREVFKSDFALLSDKFSSTRHHWHIVASDLDPSADDHQQIVETPYVLIPNNRL